MDIALKALRQQKTLVLRRRVALDDISTARSEMIGLTFRAAVDVRVGPVGEPFCRYLSQAKGVFDIEVGVPVTENATNVGEVISSMLPGGLMACLRHVGQYAQIVAAYERVEGWIKENGFVSDGEPWEIYFTDPASEPDPTKQQSEVIWPVRRA